MIEDLEDVEIDKKVIDKSQIWKNFISIIIILQIIMYVVPGLMTILFWKCFFFIIIGLTVIFLAFSFLKLLRKKFLRLIFKRKFD